MSDTPKTDALRESIAGTLEPFVKTRNKEIQEELILASIKRLLTEYEQLERELSTRPITPLQEAKDAFIEAYREEATAPGEMDDGAFFILVARRKEAWSHLQQIEEQSNG